MKNIRVYTDHPLNPTLWGKALELSQKNQGTKKQELFSLVVDQEFEEFIKNVQDVFVRVPFDLFWSLLVPSPPTLSL